MSFALHRQAVVQVAMLMKKVKKRMPCRTALFTPQECFHISNQNDAIACSGDKDVEAFRRSHEANVPELVATSEGSNNDVTLLTLIIVCTQFVSLQRF